MSTNYKPTRFGPQQATPSSPPCTNKNTTTETYDLDNFYKSSSLVPSLREHFFHDLQGLHPAIEAFVDVVYLVFELTDVRSFESADLPVV